MGGLIKSEVGLIDLIGSEISLGKPFSKEIFLVDTHVAGTNYVHNIEKISDDIVEGSKLTFFREPDNPYDELAIVVKDGKGNKIGYVPRDKNEIIARLMDAGKLIYGVVKSKEIIDGWTKLDMKIFLKD
ncbi:MAG TPA: restriction endonuclease [Tepidimicrobium sp.]|nr:restriction endonuclease [Tepidimicrobium sp.]